jgi:hypothetical protein
LVQGTAADQPTTGSLTIGGLNTISADGISDSMASQSSLDVNATGDLAFFGVCEMGAGNDRFDVIWAMDNFYDYRNDLSSGSDFNSCISHWTTPLATPQREESLLGPFNGPSVYHVRHDFTTDQTVTAWIDGTSVMPSITYNVKGPDGKLRLFRNIANNRWMNARVGELVVVKDCTTACRQKMEGYLAHKWSLEGSLPAGHPYKDEAPTA